MKSAFLQPWRRLGLALGLAVSVWVSLVGPAAAGGFDWPCFHGPDHNNISREKGWLGAWPAEGPKQLWKAAVGAGFSSVSVANGRLFTMGVVAGEETVWCLDAATGATLWKHAYPYVFKPKYYEGGSSATPTVDGDRVYALGQGGELNCFDAASGKVVWSLNIAKEHGFAVPMWGFASSPYIEGGLIILNAGSQGAALEKSSGRLVWSNGKTAAGYSSVVPLAPGDREAVVLLAAREVVALEVKSGKVIWQHPWKTEYDANIADPVLEGGKVFLSSSYGAGCALVQYDPAPPRELWRNKQIGTHINTVVLLEGHIYGVDGEAEKPAFLKCLDWKTGELKWTQSGLGMGALMAADGKLIILSEKGELVIAAAEPGAFKALARAQVLGGKCWTTPVLSNGRVYCRNAKGDLVCVEVCAR
jgi:outer membrane protein assembly factor BamB